MYEPAELEMRHFTEQDNEIRNTDIPERMQLRNFPVRFVLPIDNYMIYLVKKKIMVICFENCSDLLYILFENLFWFFSAPDNDEELTKEAE